MNSSQKQKSCRDCNSDLHGHEGNVDIKIIFKQWVIRRILGGTEPLFCLPWRWRVIIQEAAGYPWDGSTLGWIKRVLDQATSEMPLAENPPDEFSLN